MKNVAIAANPARRIPIVGMKPIPEFRLIAQQLNSNTIQFARLFGDTAQLALPVLNRGG